MRSHRRSVLAQFRLPHRRWQWQAEVVHEESASQQQQQQQLEPGLLMTASAAAVSQLPTQVVVWLQTKSCRRYLRYDPESLAADAGLLLLTETSEAHQPPPLTLLLQLMSAFDRL